MSQLVPRPPSPFAHGLVPAAINVSVGLLGVWLMLALFAQTSRGDEATGRLKLSDGSVWAGQLLATETPRTIRWQSPHFVSPFEFQLSAVEKLIFAKPTEPASNAPPADDSALASAEHQYCLELKNDDRIIGRLMAWNESDVVINADHFGELRVAVDSVRSVTRLDDSQLIFANLAGLHDWQGPRSSVAGWQEDGSMLWTEQDNALLRGDLGIPDRAIIELELAWQDQPDFVLSFGIDPEIESGETTNGWRLEVWGKTLVGVRERKGIADVSGLNNLPPDKRLRLNVYLDQTADQFTVFDAAGQLLGTVDAKPNQAQPSVDPDPDRELPFDGPGTGIQLLNRDGRLELQRLRISRWSGSLPTTESRRQITLRLDDGTTRGATGINLDPQSATVELAEQETGVPLASVVAITPAVADDESMSRAEAIAIHHDGTQQSGTLIGVNGDSLTLRSDAVDSELTVPLDQLRVLRVASTDSVDDPDGRIGQLKLVDVLSRGRLQPARETGAKPDDAGPFAWQPIGSLNASPLRQQASGTIDYDASDFESNVTESKRQLANQFPEVDGIRIGKPELRRFQRGPSLPRLSFSAAQARAQRERDPDQPHAIHFRSGDVVPCHIESIGPDGISFQSSLSTATSTSNESVKAVELEPWDARQRLDAAKRKRLLTLPRLQADAPPTHLLVSQTGDLLRCRLLSMDDSALQVELLLETLSIPRDRIAQVIWFHPDELSHQEGTDDADAESAPDSPTDLIAESYLGLVQAVRTNGDRVTFDPIAVDESAVVGRSELLGECRITLDEVDQLILGDQIRLVAAELPYQDWKLVRAVRPLIALDADGSDAGKASPLVGKPAPEINLQLLNGDQFSLSQSRGRIVVLDFWASWCPPCVQSMPGLQAAVAEFEPAAVQLVTVNLEERPEEIRGFLDRHQLALSVALDIDGLTAIDYQATAIPQTVVIDQEGRISRLFVGGGEKIIAELTAAIRDLLPQSNDAS